VHWQRVLSAEVLSCLLAPPFRNVRRCSAGRPFQLPDQSMMLRHTRIPVYSNRAEYFYPRLHWDGWLPQSHIYSQRPKAIGLYLYLGLMVIVRVSYGYGYSPYPRIGSARSITELTLTLVACEAIRYALFGGWAGKARCS